MEAKEATQSVELLDDVSCTRALMELSRSLRPLVGDRPRREELEQWMCFVAAVWNAVVTMQTTGDFSAAGELLGKIEGLSEAQRTAHSELLLELTERKLREFPRAGWLYRHVHVVAAAGGELRIRAEALSWGAWQELGTPLRMGLPD